MAYSSKHMRVDVNRSSRPIKVGNDIHFTVNDTLLVIPIDDMLKEFCSFTMCFDRTCGGEGDSSAVLSFATGVKCVSCVNWLFEYDEKDASIAIDHYACIRKIIE